MDSFPIVEAGALKVATLRAKTKRAYEDEIGSRNRTGADNITGVLRNLRLEKKDLQGSDLRWILRRLVRECFL